MSDGRGPSKMRTTPKFNENGDCKNHHEATIAGSDSYGDGDGGRRPRGRNQHPGGSGDAPAAAPKIQFDKTVYNFGTNVAGGSVTGTFTYQNTRRRPN